MNINESIIFLFCEIKRSVKASTTDNNNYGKLKRFKNLFDLNLGFWKCKIDFN